MKTNIIYNKVRNMMRGPLSMMLYALCMGLMLASCNDFLTIYPTDRTVGTDFWKTKADVDEMVNGAYLSMLDYSIQERAIVWGAFRSDELVKRSDYSSTSLDNISAVNLLPTNGYNSWAAFYKVINNCNIVLNHAPQVMDEDPEFTEGDYQTVRAQMLALRSLCYFYLVRAFRDVPYTLQAYEDDDNVMSIEQSAPAVVLQNCLDDLAEAEKYIMNTGAYGKDDWRNWGYMTKDAVRALMADIYLWRASMTHSQADYEQVKVYTQKVIDAKDTYYNETHTASMTSSGSGDEADVYHLEDGATALYTIFNYNQGNAHESILEWQYNGRNNSNTGLENYYYQAGNKDNYEKEGIFMASPVFSYFSTDANEAGAQKAFFSRNDYRFWNVVYDAGNEEAQQLSVRKMIEPMGLIIAPGSATTSGASKSNSRAFTEFRQNWVVYRLTDVMLMQAEAYVETAANDSDLVSLEKAFNLVQVVNKRSMLRGASDVLNFNDFKSKDDMELLVLAERQRELCFEGKRWFDLMRYSYRHMQGVDINQRLADQGSWPALYSPMLKLVVRKFGDGGQGDAVIYKMKSEPYLYWPVQESETKVNSLLKQNPVYIQEKSTSKN